MIQLHWHDHLLFSKVNNAINKCFSWAFCTYTESLASPTHSWFWFGSCGIFVLFCFVFNNSQIFMYSFIKSLRWQIAFGGQWKLWETPCQHLELFPVERNCSGDWPSLLINPVLFSQSLLLAYVQPALAHPKTTSCLDFSLWTNPSRHSFGLLSQVRGKRQKQQAESHLILGLETGD